MCSEYSKRDAEKQGFLSLSKCSWYTVFMFDKKIKKLAVISLGVFFGVLSATTSAAQAQIFVPTGTITIEPTCTANGNITILVQTLYATEVRVSDVSDLSGSGFVSIPSDNLVSWQLSGEDGDYTIYAQFRGENGLVSQIATDTVKLDRRSSCGSVSFTQTTNFQVQTNGSDRVVVGPIGGGSCGFSFKLVGSDSVRDESMAARLNENGADFFVFNHPVESDRVEVIIRRQVSGCRAVFSITELNQPASQFALVVTPTMNGRAYESLTIWEHISLGPLTPIKPQSPQAPPQCSESEVFNRMNTIGVWSEELRIEGNRRNDLAIRLSQSNDKSRELARMLVEGRDRQTRLKDSLSAWQNYDTELSTRLDDIDNKLNSANEAYRALQNEYADNGQVAVVEGDQPLQQLSSGVSVSLDGGQTWLVLSGEGGIRAFIGRLQANKNQGRELHRRGQLVKDLQAQKFELNSLQNEAKVRIEQINTNLKSYSDEVDKLQQQLGNSKFEKIQIESDIKNVDTKINNLRERLEAEQLLLDGCNLIEKTAPVSLWQRVTKFLGQIIAPIIVAYGR